LLIEPARALRLNARVHGVRYPQGAIDALRAARIEYRGWIANYLVPRAFSRFRATIHIPRRPYVEALPGIPTIRVFEALACGIPLISAPWDDVEHLFTPGEDYLVAANTASMIKHLRAVLSDRELAAGLAERGLRIIHERHTCAHRVDELLGICAELGVRSAPAPSHPSHLTLCVE
ncbi:MAG: CgeB family protein, partial [Gemmatimonadota bacterium]